MSQLIRVAHLTKSFGQQQVIKNISFEVNQGEIFVILGKNGAGKTTLIKMLLGILSADEGTISCKGKDLSSYGQGLYHFVSAVLENAENTYGYLTAAQNIEYFAALYGRKISKADIQALLVQFDLADEGKKRVSTFSRGMKQKLSIITSLLNDSEILFLDEPTLGLDFKANKDLLKMVKMMAQELGKTVILTSHQADVIDQLADSVMLLDNGEISYQGTYADFIEKNSLTSYEIKTESQTYHFEEERNAEEKLKALVNDGQKILSFGKRGKTIDEILIDFYERGDERRRDEGDHDV